MKFPTLTIAAETVSKRNKRYGVASRVFQATLLCMVSWPKKEYKDPIRPIFLDYCGTEAEHRAFTANLRCGRPASLGDGRSPDKVELLKSEQYLYATPQRCEAGVRQIVYLPGVFDLETKLPDDRIQLCVMPPAKLLDTVTQDELRAVAMVFGRRVKACEDAAEATEQERQRILIEEADRYYWRRTRVPDPPKAPELDGDDLRYWALVARELGVRLDGRTRFPVPVEPEFRAMLVQSLVQEGLYLAADCPLRKLKTGYGGPKTLGIWGSVEAAGYLPPLAIDIEQDALGAVLTALAQEFYK